MRLPLRFLVLAGLAGLVSPSPRAAVERPAWPLNVAQAEAVPGVHKAWLADRNGSPFLWIADTCWFLTFQASDEEVLHYLENRARKGINVIQCMLIPWAREGDDHWFGERPFHDQKFDQPNEAYGEHVDFVVRAAQECQLTR